MARSFIHRKFSWNGEAIPFPTTFSWAFQDISSTNTGRSLSGLMNKEIVATKRKISCSWKMLSDADAANLLSKVKAFTYGDLTYPDAFEGRDLTKKFYTGDATANMITVTTSKDHFGGTADETFLWDIAFDFIEQ